MKVIIKNKLNTIILVLILPIITQIPFQVKAQNPELEAVVYIYPDSLEFPQGIINTISINNLLFKSDRLKNVLSDLSFESIGKAFPNFSENDTLKTLSDGRTISRMNFSRVFKLKFKNEDDLNNGIEKLSSLKSVLFVEKNYAETSLSTSIISNVVSPDELYPEQWHLNNTGGTGTGMKYDADIDAPEAWNLFPGNSDAVIAIMDTGVELNHDDLSGKSFGDTPEQNGSYGYSHGTVMAGTAAAKEGGGKVKGVNRYAQIMSKKVFSGTTECSNGLTCPKYKGFSEVANLITQAVDEGADVINYSVNHGQESYVLREAFAYTYKMNRVISVSMGNKEHLIYPATAGNDIIAVGASNDDDVVPEFSNTGSHIDVAAPGRNVITTDYGNSYGKASGTSVSAAIVSGISALIRRNNEVFVTNNDIKQLLQLTADDIMDDGFDIESGYGRVSAYDAIKRLKNPYVFEPHRWETGVTYSMVKNDLEIEFYGVGDLKDGTYYVDIYDVRKTVPLPDYHNRLVWCNGLYTNGFDWEEPMFAKPFCEVISSNSSSATLRTYVYDVYDEESARLGWVPTSPDSVNF